MRDKMMKFMEGRYGMDKFSRFLLGLDLVLAVLSLFSRGRILSVLVLAILIYVYFRMFSRNISLRYTENLKYLEATAKFRRNFKKQMSRLNQRKAYRFYKCPTCSQKVRVPKGKGKIEIRCPRCNTKFIKRS